MDADDRNGKPSFVCSVVLEIARASNGQRKRLLLLMQHSITLGQDDLSVFIKHASIHEQYKWNDNLSWG